MPATSAASVDSLLPVPPYPQQMLFLSGSDSPSSEDHQNSTVKVAALDVQVENQVTIVRKALEQLEEGKKKVAHQRQGIEDDLNKGLRFLAEAHQECLRSLRDANAKTSFVLGVGGFMTSSAIQLK